MFGKRKLRLCFMKFQHEKLNVIAIYKKFAQTLHRLEL